MLHVVTTVAQHPRGLDLHLRNLRWALAGCEHRVAVQTFADWGFDRDDVELLVAAGRDPREHYGFWDRFALHALAWATPGSLFLFMQQDILFTRPVSDLVRRAGATGNIVVNLESPYLAVYNGAGERVYPRIWEGATLLPGAVVAAAVADGIGFGYRHEALRPGRPLFERHRRALERHLTTTGGDPGTGLEPLADLLARPYTDTMTELTAWCFLGGVGVDRDPANDRAYELGARVVHFRGPESLHIDHPEVYESIAAIRAAGPRYERRRADCALMYLLSGVHGKSPEMAALLGSKQGGALFHEKVDKLATRAGEWMSADEFGRLRWAARQLARPTQPARGS